MSTTRNCERSRRRIARHQNPKEKRAIPEKLSTQFSPIFSSSQKSLIQRKELFSALFTTPRNFLTSPFHRRNRPISALRVGGPCVLIGRNYHGGGANFFCPRAKKSVLLRLRALYHGNRKERLIRGTLSKWTRQDKHFSKYWLNFPNSLS